MQPTSLKYLLFGPFQKSIANSCCVRNAKCNHQDNSVIVSVTDEPEKEIQWNQKEYSIQYCIEHPYLRGRTKIIFI